MNQVSNRSPMQDFKHNLVLMHEQGELQSLPANVSFESFKNAAIVAVQDNPQILSCDRASLFTALRKLAAAGLVPDGREAALVPFKGKAQAMPMVFGLIKQARNSGEIASLWARIVREGEAFRMWVDDGELKFDHEMNPFNQTGAIVGAYAVAKLKDGATEIETMGLDEIEKRRKASATQKGNEPSGIWVQWYDEMAKKTVIRALCKRLPLQSEDMRRIMVEQDPAIKDVTPQEPEAPRKTLAQKIMDDEAPKAVEGEVLLPEDVMPEGKPDPFSPRYEDGRLSFGQGASLKDCPHDLGTQDWVDWAGGWNFSKKKHEEAE